MTETEQKEV